MLSRSGDLIAGVNEAPLRAGPASFGGGMRSRTPEQLHCKVPAFRGAQGWACRWFMESGADVQPLPLQLGPAWLCAHPAKRAFIPGMLSGPHPSPTPTGTFAIPILPLPQVMCGRLPGRGSLLRWGFMVCIKK